MRSYMIRCCNYHYNNNETFKYDIKDILNCEALSAEWGEML